MIFLNLDIWANAESEVQDNMINKLKNIIENNGKILKIDKIVDYLLSSIETCVNKKEDLSNAIQQFSDITIKLVQDNLSDLIISKLISYINIYYMRRLPNYPLQLFYFLRILLGLFLSCKEKLFKEIKESIKKKKENKLLTTLFVIMDYILFFKSNPEASQYPGIQLSLSPREKETKITEEKEDPISSFLKTKKGMLIIDSIQAMTLYMLLSFDWGSMSDVLKDFPKEDLYTIPQESSGQIPVITEKRNIDVLGFFLKSLGKNLPKNASIF